MSAAQYGRCLHPKRMNCTHIHIDAILKAHIPYESIWLVFDKDDFPTFEQAIILAEQNDFKVAWSNPSFEYWLFLHFAYSDSNLHREEWTIKLRNHFQKNIPECETYSKNMKKIFKIVTQHGSLKAAISRGRRIHEDHIKASNSPDNCCPCTKVYALIENFSPYLDDLLL